MKLGLLLPTSTPDSSGKAILDFARIADQGGLDSVWVIDRLLFPLVESLSSLAAAAAVTSNVKLGTNVLISPNREPALLASQAASIDVLSGGRMLLGVGVGSRADDYELAGRDFKTRGRRMETDVTTMRRIWAGESVLVGYGSIGPRPAQGTIPVLFGGSSDPAIARGARIGEGHMCIPRGLDRQVEQFQKFRDAWTAAGRQGKPVIYGGGYYCVDSSAERARERLLAYQQHYYGDRQRASGMPPTGAEFDLVGPPEAIAEALLAYDQLDAEALVLLPISADPYQAEVIAGPVQEIINKRLG